MDALCTLDIFLIEKSMAKIKINFPIGIAFIGSVFELQVGYSKYPFQWN